LTGLDRRLVERTDVQYTCPCPVPVAETANTGGQAYSSASPSSTAAGAESTDDCEDYVPAANVGAMADGEITDNETPAKRFLPLEYSIAHPIEKRLYDPPPPSFVPDGELKKRTEPTGAVTDNPNGAPTTVTSTTTITGNGNRCSSDWCWWCFLRSLDYWRGNIDFRRRHRRCGTPYHQCVRLTDDYLDGWCGRP
jgi:hypothetical protein